MVPLKGPGKLRIKKRIAFPIRTWIKEIFEGIQLLIGRSVKATTHIETHRIVVRKRIIEKYTWKKIGVITFKGLAIDELYAICNRLLYTQSGLNTKLRPVVRQIDIRCIDLLIIQEVIADRTIENRLVDIAFIIKNQIVIRTHQT